MQFHNPLDPGNIQLIRTLKCWVKERFELEDDTEVIFQEHNCADASCPDKMVKFAFEKGDLMKSMEIRKPLVFIRKRDIEGAVLK